MLAQRARTAPGSGLARAFDYSLKRWDALSRYVESGVFPIDNNPIENAIRPIAIAIGKKNWMFVGTERVGQRAAAIQSLFATAKANGLEPDSWLKETLEKLPTHPYSRIDELIGGRAERLRPRLTREHGINDNMLFTWVSAIVIWSTPWLRRPSRH